MPTSTRINPAFRADVGIRPYDYDALNNHLHPPYGMQIVVSVRCMKTFVEKRGTMW